VERIRSEGSGQSPFGPSKAGVKNDPINLAFCAIKVKGVTCDPTNYMVYSN